MHLRLLKKGHDARHISCRDLANVSGDQDPVGQRLTECKVNAIWRLFKVSSPLLIIDEDAGPIEGDIFHLQEVDRS